MISLNPFYARVKSVFKPTEIYENVESINLEKLLEKGIDTLLLDVDNTILKYTEKTISLRKLKWIHRAKALGFTIFVLSNNSSKRRIEKLANEIEVKGLYFSLKPFPFAAQEHMNDYQLSKSQCAVIGDQLFTDIILGNMLGVHSILVDPMDKSVSLIKTAQREIELNILKKIQV